MKTQRLLVVFAAAVAIVAGALGIEPTAKAVSAATEPTCSATQLPPCVFQGFEIDGNTSVDAAGNLDWQSPPPNLTHFTDATGPTDGIFSGGSKELDQSTWVCTNGSAPPKDDIYPGGDISFRNYTLPGTTTTHQVIDVDFSRVGTGGDAHIDYEFNKATQTLNTAGCPAANHLPLRSVGDILLTFDSNLGGSKVTVSAYRWTGSTFTQLSTGSQGVTFDGVENGITNANGVTSYSDPGVQPGQYGEAGLDLTATIGNLTCGEFGDVYMKTRSSTAITSEVKDRTQVLPFNPGACPSSSLTKAVRDDTTNPGGSFSAGPITANPGDQLTYQLTYTNSGQAAASNVTVSDPIPTGTTYVANSCTPPTCTVSNGTISWPAIASVEPNVPEVFTFSVTLTGPFPQGTTAVSNFGTVTTTEEGSKNSNTVIVNVTANPILHITKTADSASVSNGQTIGYTITVINTGTAAASNVTITDNLPTNAGLSWSITPATSGCGIAPSPPVLTCNVGTLAAGASFSVHISSPTTSATCGTVSNSATVTATGVTAITSSPLTTIVVNCAAIGISKTADAGTVAAGQQVGYTITVTNSGAGTAFNVKVSDTLPNSPSGLSWSMSPTVSGCSISTTNPQVLSCTFASVGPNSSIPIHVISQTTTAMCGTLTNTASVTSDNAGSGATGTVSITLTCPHLAITKTADQATINSGDQIGFTITVSNTGTGAANNVTVTDNLPSGMTWSLSPANTPAGCGIAGTPQVLTCTFSSIAAGSFVTIHVVATTSQSNCGTVSNSATVTSSNNNPTSLTSSPITTVTVNCPSIHITKVADQGSVTLGSQIGYTITVSNSGPGTAYNVAVNDTLPNNGGLSWSMSPSVTGCSISTTNPQVLSCNFASMPANTSISIHVISPTTASSCGTVSNSASVTLSNGTGAQTATVNISVLCAVLHVSKTACPQSSVVPGGLLTYTISYSNSGTATADPATLVDTIPANTTVANSGGGTVSSNGSTVTWQVGPLAPGGSGTKTLIVLVNAANGATLSNTVTLSAPQATATASNTVTTSVSNAGAITHGSAYGLDVNALGLDLINHVGAVSTVAPGSPQTAANDVLTVPSILGAVSANVIDTTSNSSVNNQSESTSTATTAHLNLLGGAITADVVKGVSQSVAGPTTASYNSDGSTFTNLVINGTSYANVRPNTRVTVYLPGTKTVVANAVLYEESGGAAFSNNLWTAEHSVTMIDVTLVQGFMTLPAGAVITVSHAQTDATYPSGLACGAQPNTVSGNAFSAFANGTFNGATVVNAQVGDAELPPYGGDNSDSVASVLIPSAVLAGAGTNYTYGTTSPNPSATSGAAIASVNILGGLVTADALDVKASSSASSTSASTTFGATCANNSCPSGCSTSSPCFVNLSINGTTIVGSNGGTVTPNTTYEIPQSDGSLVIVILNEQTVSSSGSNTEGDINAIHVYVLRGAAVSAEVIVAHAHSDAHHS